MIHALAIAAALAQSPAPGYGPSMQQHSGRAGAGPVTLFSAPLSASGLPGCAVPDGVDAPVICWSGDDPTGALGISSHTFTAVGSPGSVGTPFCPDGDFSAIDSGGCVDARVFDKATTLYHSTAAGAEVTWADSFSGWVIFRPDDVTISNSLMALETTAQDLFLLYGNNSLCTVYAAKSGGSSGTTGTPAALSAGAWAMCAFAYDASGQTITAYAKGGALPDATPLDVSTFGTLTWSRVDIGSQRLAPTTVTDGAIAMAAIVPGVMTAAQFTKIYDAWMGVLDEKGRTVTLTTTGPLCEWFDGKIECFGDDWAPVGSEMPPGATGAGSPAKGLLSVPTFTQSLLYSRDFSTGWTETGTSVAACSQSSTPFRDGRTTCKLTDNDGAAQEYTSQTVALAAVDTSDKIQIVIYAAADDGDQSIDLQVDEATGASCTPSTADFTAKAISTTWTAYFFEHTVADGDCTDFTIDIYPSGDAADTAATGHAYVVAQVYSDVPAPPPMYIETTSAATAAGLVNPKYAIPDGDVLNDPGDELIEHGGLAFNWTQGVSSQTGNRGLLYLNGTSDHSIFMQNTGVVTWYDQTANASTGALSWTQGTTKHLDLRWARGAFRQITTDGGTPAATASCNIAQNLVDIAIGDYGVGFQQTGWMSDLVVTK